MIGRADYQTLRKILLENSGHALGDGKEYLVERRLQPVAESLDFPGLAALVGHIRLTGDRRTVKLVCEAMTTNESLFFRDDRPFELLRKSILPELMEARKHARRLRIWSAACSTGQEAYSIAMTLAEFTPSLADWTIEIVGTDYSPTVVSRAREGVFNHFEVQRGLPVQMLIKYFDQVDTHWQVKPALKRSVTFREGNLLQPFGHLGVFDVVFCRNVLIYFDVAGKRDVLGRLARVTARDGYLFLGSSETALGITDRWSVVEGATTTLFRRADAAARAPAISSAPIPARPARATA